MTKENIVWMCAGVILGLMVTFYEVDPTPTQDCVAYKIRQRPVTAYVLKPPYQAPEVIHEKCEPKPQVTLEPENVSRAETTKEDDRKTNRHRRHRYRRYWR